MIPVTWNIVCVLIGFSDLSRRITRYLVGNQLETYVMKRLWYACVDSEEAAVFLDLSTATIPSMRTS